MGSYNHTAGKRSSFIILLPGITTAWTCYDIPELMSIPRRVPLLSVSQIMDSSSEIRIIYSEWGQSACRIGKSHSRFGLDPFGNLSHNDLKV